MAFLNKTHCRLLLLTCITGKRDQFSFPESAQHKQHEMFGSREYGLAIYLFRNQNQEVETELKH